jgi:hypothetical protein
MAFELYLRAVESSIAELIGRFADTPDRYWRDAELRADYFRALQACDLLATLYRTRDGRLTGLLHADYPPLQAFVPGDETAPADARYDLALLNPRFVRASTLAVVAGEVREDPLRFTGEVERPTPLIAALQLKLVANADPPTMAKLQAAYHTLVRAEPDAARTYMAVFCRHWDLNGPGKHLLAQLDRWATNQPHVSLVFVQAHADDIGRVWGGRYFGLWSHTAALPPLSLTP